MEIKKGQLLIAEPSIIGDTSFNRSIILLAEHGQEGSIGFIMNKPLKYSLEDLIPEVQSDFKIYNGGPVQQDNLYFIHCVPELIPKSVKISNGLYWSGNFDQVTRLIAEDKIQENEIRFFLGYSGWDNEQLASELSSNTWILTENSHQENIIHAVDDTFWKNKMIAMGDAYSIWSNAPENPMYN